MSEPRALSVEQRSLLRSELAREDLSSYTVVRLARKDVEVGHFDTAMARLRIDADKLRPESPVLIELMRCQMRI